MTRVDAGWVRRHEERDTFEIDAAPDDIGTGEVIDAIHDKYPFDEVDYNTVDWEIRHGD